MKSLKLNLGTMMRTMAVAVIALLSFNVNAQTKAEIAKQYHALETESDQLIHKYADKFSSDEFMEAMELTEEEQAEMNRIEDKEAKKSESQRMQEFVDFYEDVNGKRSLDKILKRITKDEKRARFFMDASERENATVLFDMQRERAKIESEMYDLAKQYLGR